MKIQHKTKDENKIREAQEDPKPSIEAFLKAFIEDNAANTSKLTPALRAFVEQYIVERDKKRAQRARREKQS